MRWQCKDLGRSFSLESKYWSFISKFGQFYCLWKTFQSPQKNISVAWILKDDLWNKSPVFPDCTKVVPITRRLQVLASKFDWLLWLSLPVVTGQANHRLRHFPALSIATCAWPGRFFYLPCFPAAWLVQCHKRLLLCRPFQISELQSSSRSH